MTTVVIPNKAQVDGLEQQVAAATNLSTPNTLVRRNPAGEAVFHSIDIDTAPDADWKATRKDYVDGQIATRVPTSQKGAANGVATLDAGGKVPQAQLPSVAISDFLGTVSSQATMLALTGQRGDWATRTDLNVDFILIADDPTLLASWRQITSPGNVTSVAGRTGAVALTHSDVTDWTESVQDTLASTIVAGTNVTATYDDTAGTYVISAQPPGLTSVGIADMPAGTIIYMTQNANGTWPNRLSNRTDLLGIWIRTVAGSGNPAAATSPAVTGAYQNDLVVGA